MRFSKFSATTIVPTLARLVLAVAFIPPGYNKLFTSAEFTPEQAAILQHYGVSVRMVGVSPNPDTSTDFAPQSDTDRAPLDIVPQADAVYSASAMHGVTLRCHDAGWPFPTYLAALAALTELLGGVLLLAGFLSRIWGLGLAVAMSVAFYLYTVRTLGVLQENLFAFANQINDFNALVAQLGLFALAIGILLTGPGPLSVDRLLSDWSKKGTSPKEALTPLYVKTQG